VRNRHPSPALPIATDLTNAASLRPAVRGWLPCHVRAALLSRRAAVPARVARCVAAAAARVVI
jgi:hypothetical protein